MDIAPTLRNYSKKNLAKDILAGLIIMAVSIPISMGYAQIAGLTPIYGLYGSIFPIIIFGLMSTSRQFIFGVDAAPAALVGAALLSFGIEAQSPEALSVVPMLTFFVAIWLMLFSILRAGKFVNFISEPVMGGFITGICTTIILMQVPKVLGGTSGTGELLELLRHLYDTAKHINVPSLIMGGVALAILLIMKKVYAKFPTAVVLMVLGGLSTIILPTKEWGITNLSKVDAGLPKWIIPDFSTLVPHFDEAGHLIDTGVTLSQVVVVSLSIAVVIMAEPLLAENSFALKNDYKIQDNREIMAFSVGNFIASFTGCCPINGSVSRTAMNEQYGGRTQLTGIIAGLAMIPVVLFATGFIAYLPVPVLTAIVISALLGATEFGLARKLWKVSRTEFFIFTGAFLGVLMLGTINGVLIGIVLSFAEMIIRSANPSRCFLGIQPGHRHFHQMNKSGNLFPVQNVVIYRFNESLFFANIGIFQEDIENAIKEDTKAVIVDARAVGSIDITAAERLASMHKKLKNKGVKLYLTEHSSSLNDQLRALGLGYLIEEGAVRRTIHIALKDVGINRPYPLVGAENYTEITASRKRVENRIQEFTWAFGNDTEAVIERQIKIQIDQLRKTGDLDELFHSGWYYMQAMDEDEWVEHLEEHMKEIVSVSGKDEKTLAIAFERHRQEVLERIQNNHPELAQKFLERRESLDKHLQERRPEAYELVKKIRERNKLKI
ncbi:MAG: SulP family inorganic anion transporter [Saccharofermentans sp.]|nr:SulP family inorganic anion transporter [Saccharofermentans sp.]